MTGRTVWVASSPTGVYHTSVRCYGVEIADQVAAEDPDDHPDKRLCKKCKRNHEARNANDGALPNDGVCPWPDCSGDLERRKGAGATSLIRCHACGRDPERAPDGDVPAWQVV